MGWFVAFLGLFLFLNNPTLHNECSLVVLVGVIIVAISLILWCLK
jgi:hypothetical protein